VDYNTYRSGGGYNVRPARAPAATAVPSVPAASDQGLNEISGKEGQFSELRVTGGVGPFHINHFIGYSGFIMLSKPAEVVAPLAARFYRDFVKLFEPNEAEADLSQYEFKGADTIEFSIGGKKFELLEHIGGFLHSDWVSLQQSDDRESFYASTLRRRWLLFKEQLALSGLKSLSTDLASNLIEFIRVNQHHFLAGRRSFRFGYDEKLHRCYVETAAFERSSICEYYLAEKTGLLREAVIELWTNLLANVQASFGGLWVPPVLAVKAEEREGYQTRDNVDYRTASFPTAAEALSQPWFAKVLTRHPGLLKGL
jgi:hypothetical protein